MCEAGRKGSTSFQDLTLLPCAQRAPLCPLLLSTSLCACLLSSAVVYTLPSTRGDGFFFLLSFVFFHRALPGLLLCVYTPPSTSPFSLIHPICRQKVSQAWSVRLHVITPPPPLHVSNLAPLAFLLLHMIQFLATRRSVCVEYFSFILTD